MILMYFEQMLYENQQKQNPGMSAPLAALFQKMDGDAFSGKHWEGRGEEKRRGKRGIEGEAEELKVQKYKGDRANGGSGKGEDAY